MSYVHIYAPPTLRKKAFVCDACPDCGAKTLMLSFFQEWYGWHSTCIKCGRQWEDGEWLALPFMRGARAKSVAEAKTRWRRTRNQDFPKVHVRRPTPTEGGAG